MVAEKGVSCERTDGSVYLSLSKLCQMSWHLKHIRIIAAICVTIVHTTYICMYFFQDTDCLIQYLNIGSFIVTP